MVQVTRRSFLLSAAAFSAGCASRGHGAAQPTPATGARQPAVGQSWRYAKHDLYSRKLVDDQTDRITAVGTTVDIDSQSEAVAASKTERPSWGSAWLSKYVPHPDTPPDRALPSEIQQPWGKILVDPHWGQVQVYEAPIPLWPIQLRAGWKYHVITKYKTPTHQDGLPWDQTMTVRGWETVTVPAGTFKALRYQNLINFRSTDLSWTAAQRMESIWFAPEVGRWVVRESSGSYYINDSSVDTPYDESSYRWELLAWT